MNRLHGISALCALLIAGLVCAASAANAAAPTSAAPGCVPPPQDMVGWWPLDEEDGEIAADLVWHNDGTLVGPGIAHVDGKVGGALDFGGSSLGERRIDIPPGPIAEVFETAFTFDAWVKLSSFGSIVSKATFGGPGPGWLVLADTIGSTGNNLGLWVEAYGTDGYLLYQCGTVPLDEWAHIAVGMERAGDDWTVTCFIDGSLAQSPETVELGSIANDSNLVIGKAPSLSAMRGIIDEIELFSRALSEEEVASIVEGDADGKCKDDAHIPWDVQYCAGHDTVEILATVCNDATAPRDYALVSGQPEPTSINATCNSPGPTDFDFSTAPVTIPGGDCHAFPVTVTRPPTLDDPDDVGCYSITIANLTQDYEFTRPGSVWGTDMVCFNGPSTVVEAAALQTVRLSFEVALDDRQGGLVGEDGEGSSPAPMLYTIDAMPSDLRGPNEVLSLNGAAPGTPARGYLYFDRSGVAQVLVDATFLEHEPFRFYDLVISTQPPGARRPRVMGSIGLRSTGVPDAIAGAGGIALCGDRLRLDP